MPLLAFLVSLVLGTLGVLLNAPWWVAPGVVLVYGALAWGMTHVAIWPSRDVVQDSPYYLGFLLTQIALAITFLHISFDSAGTVANPHQLARNVSIALMTSIIGLLARHAITSTNRAEGMRQGVIDSMRLDLERNVASYDQAQQTFVRLVTEFSSKHDTLLSEEKRIGEEYVRSLKSTVAALSLAHQTVNPLVGQATTATQNLSALAQMLDGVTARFGLLQTAAAAATTAVDQLKQKATSAGGSAQTMQQELDAINKIIDEFVVLAQKRIIRL